MLRYNLADYPNDESIPNESELLRRIPPLHFVRDPKAATGVRCSSAAFMDSGDGTPMSVYVHSILVDGGRTAQAVIDGHEGFGLVRFSAGSLREAGQNVGLFRDHDPAHAYVAGKKSESSRKAMARATTWVIGPSAVP